MLIENGYLCADLKHDILGGIEHANTLFAYSYYANKEYHTQFVSVDFWGDLASRALKVRGLNKGAFAQLSMDNVYVNEKSLNNYLKATVLSFKVLPLKIKDNNNKKHTLFQEDIPF